MTYFIFLKYLRSLEEFRKNPHVKIPPNFPCANFQSLGKFKNPILNSKIFLLHFRPSYPYRPTRLSAQLAPLAHLLPQAEANFAGPSRSAHVHHWRICRNTFSSLIHAFRSRRLLSIHPLTHGAHLSVSSSPLRRPTPARSAPWMSPSLYRPPPSSLPPSIPFKPATAPSPSPSPIKATPRTPGALHTSPRSFLLLSRTGTPHHRIFPTATMPPRRPVATPPLAPR
jgi:hypothetical protein